MTQVILVIILWVSNAISINSIIQGIRHKAFCLYTIPLQLFGLVCAIWYTVIIFEKLYLI